MGGKQRGKGGPYKILNTEKFSAVAFLEVTWGATCVPVSYKGRGRVEASGKHMQRVLEQS
jgi:hypothetical protein